MALEIYAILLLGYILMGILQLLEKKKHLEIVSVGVNVLIWIPFVGRSMGWW